MLFFFVSSFFFWPVWKQASYFDREISLKDTFKCQSINIGCIPPHNVLMLQSRGPNFTNLILHFKGWLYQSAFTKVPSLCQEANLSII